MAEKKLFLLDAMALLYRAHFAFIKNPRITSNGQNTSAVFGFTNSILEILNKENPTHLAVAYDVSGPTFRHEDFPEYKANREEMPEDISWAIPTSKRLLKALNIPILEMAGYEADDLIGTIAKRAEGHGYQVYMVTPDKDFAQLVTNNIYLYKPSRMGNGIDILNPDKVKEKMGILPEKVADFLGLKGDKVDNIPGIPKIGDKTAVQLIEEFGSVEEIVARAAEIQKKSIRESVQEHGEQGLLSKQLATIIIDAPIPWDEEDLKIGNPTRDDVVNICQELEFRNTAQRLLQSPIFTGEDGQQKDLFGNPVGGGASAAAAIKEEITDHLSTLEEAENHYKLIKTQEDLDKLVKKIREKGAFCFDTETTGLDAMLAELIAVTISLEPHEGSLIHFPEGDEEALKMLEPIKELIADEKILKIGQNLKYDLLVLKKYGVSAAGPMFDTMLANYVINPDGKHGMDAMARDYLNYEPISITSLIGKKGKNQLSMRDVPLEKLVDYACEDSDVTLQLKNHLDPELDRGDVRKVFDEVEMPLMPVLTEMEYIGIKVNEEELAEYSKELEVELENIEKEIHSMAGVEFNINSPKQLGEVIFDKLKLAKGKKTKSGQYSTREEVLVELADDHELPAYVLRYRQLGKLKSTYVDALPGLINPNTGRIHTTFSQAVAATGRLSSNHPNLQNIPIRTPEGRRIRGAFIPEKGFKLLAADYSQVELRLMAHLSEDPGMLEAFNEKQDIHRATAAKVFDVSPEEVDSNMRSKAKMVNFGIIYGISAFGLAQRLKISRSEAKDIIDAYFDKYPKVKEYMDKSIELARKNGYAETIMGRKRYLPDINSANHTIKGFAERNAINTPVQGSAADLIKIAMINIHAEMKARNLKSRMMLQVHDELVFEAHESEIDELTTLVKDKMEHAMEFKVPMLVEAGIADNWLDAH